MPSNVIAKIKSAPKALAVATILAAALIFVGIFFFYGRSDHRPVLKVNGLRYHLEIADTDTSQKTGLSGREELPEDNGMLFVFPKQERRCFWMKRMLFPLDIVWLDGNKRVVMVEGRISPATYPQAFCAEAMYVIELNAGQAENAGINKGQVLNF